MLWLPNELLLGFTRQKLKIIRCTTGVGYTKTCTTLVLSIVELLTKNLVNLLIITISRIVYQNLRSIGKNIKSLVAMHYKILLSVLTLLLSGFLNLNLDIQNLKPVADRCDRDVAAAMVMLNYARGMERASTDVDENTSTYCGSFKKVSQRKRQKQLAQRSG